MLYHKEEISLLTKLFMKNPNKDRKLQYLPNMQRTRTKEKRHKKLMNNKLYKDMIPHRMLKRFQLHIYVQFQ